MKDHASSQHTNVHSFARQVAPVQQHAASSRHGNKLHRIAFRARRSLQIDAENVRLMSTLGQIASLAYQIVESIGDSQVEIAARKKAETALLQLATGFFGDQRSGASSPRPRVR